MMDEGMDAEGVCRKMYITIRYSGAQNQGGRGNKRAGNDSERFSQRLGCEGKMVIMSVWMGNNNAPRVTIVVGRRQLIAVVVQCHDQQATYASTLTTLESPLLTYARGWSSTDGRLLIGLPTACTLFNKIPATSLALASLSAALSS